MNLVDVKYAIEKEYGVELKDEGTHFSLEKETPKTTAVWFIQEYPNHVFVSYEVWVKAKDIYLECRHTITAKYHLQEFFTKVKDLNSLAKFYF